VPAPRYVIAALKEHTTTAPPCSPGPVKVVVNMVWLGGPAHATLIDGAVRDLTRSPGRIAGAAGTNRSRSSSSARHAIARIHHFATTALSFCRLLSIGPAAYPDFRCLDGANSRARHYTFV